MKHKRAIVTGIMMWFFISVIFLVLMFAPFLQGKEMMQFAIFWVLLIPLTLLSAKWYFKMDSPNLKKGLCLGLIICGVALILDMFITVPIFVKSYANFFGDWKLYASLSEILLLCLYAGWEFDETYTRREDIK